MRRRMSKEEAIRIKIAVKRMLGEIDVDRFVVIKGRGEMLGANGKANQDERRHRDDFCTPASSHRFIKNCA
jgi:hypothetical protein